MFRIADISPTNTIIQHIKERSDFTVATRAVRPSRRYGLVEVHIAADIFAELKAAAERAVEEFGLHGWLTSEGRQHDNPYRSLSLTHNPDLRDPAITDVHQSTLGSSVNGKGEFYYGRVERFAHLKNTYFDTYGFRKPTPAAQIGGLGSFLANCNISLVRSRLSVLAASEAEDFTFDFGWHRDESIFENLRVNIPITSDPSYQLQIEHERLEPDPESKTMTMHHLKPGYAYSFDTNKPHRVFPTRPTEVARLHLVLGFSPWLKYDPKEDAWHPNEFYGHVHPLDILANGLLHPKLTIPAS